MELAMSEDASILGVKAEDNADTEYIEPAKGLGRRVIVLCKQRLINPPYDFTGFHRHLHLLCNMLALYVNKEL